ncbi:MAG: helix-turn-helix domain-containing protein [Lacipirellulaceae bacterium]
MKPHPPGSGPFAGTVSLAEVARRWGASRRDVRRLAATGRLPFVEVAGHIRVAATGIDPPTDWDADPPNATEKRRR